VVARNLFLAVELQGRRFWLVVGWALVLLVIYLSLTPTPIEVPLAQGDKLSHVLAYLVLMSWFANIYQSSIRRIEFALGFIVLGVGLEFVQRWTGYRSFEVADMAAGTVGVTIGWILAPPRMPNYLGIMESLWRNNH